MTEMEDSNNYILFTWTLETPTSLEDLGATLLMMGLTPENEP